MNGFSILAGVLFVAIVIFAITKLKGVVLSVDKITRIGVFAGATIVLYMIKLVPFPQGGGCSLLSILPIMVLSVVFGEEEGLICAIIVAALKLIVAKPYFLMQIPLDYFGAMMALPIVGLFKGGSLKKLFLGGMTAVSVSCFFSVLSGVIFFGKYAPEGMNEFIYSLVYNVTGYGVEAVISVVILIVLPLDMFKRRYRKEVL